MDPKQPSLNEKKGSAESHDSGRTFLIMTPKDAFIFEYFSIKFFVNTNYQESTFQEEYSSFYVDENMLIFLQKMA